jgi:hypothetical protein
MNGFPKINAVNFHDTVLVYMSSFNTPLLLNSIDYHKSASQHFSVHVWCPSTHRMADHSISRLSS